MIDPESGLDAVRNVGIRGDRIAALAETRLRGRATLDGTGLVLGPGLIDVHSHGMNVPSNWLHAFDGVTTALELEGGAWPVAPAYAAAAAQGRPINYGYASGWAHARRALFGTRATALLEQQDSDLVVAAVAEGLDAGGIGIALTPGYLPDSNRTEYLALATLAASRGVPTFTHARHKNLSDPGSVAEGVGEIIAAAAMTGARMHICHINSTATRALPAMLDAIARAQRAGIGVTIEAYPWGAGSTGIGAPFLSPENLPLMGMTPRAIEYLRTGERVADNDRLRAIRAADPRGRAIIHYFDESVPGDLALMDAAVLFPGAMIASDAVPYVLAGRDFTEARWPLPEGVSGHPRSAATFMRVLRRHVIEQRRMTLADFFRRASLDPARLIEPADPSMRDRGRVRVGAIADLVLIDLARVEARASYARPALPSAGVRALIVAGQFVIRDGKLIPAARPGRAIRGPHAPTP